MKYFITELRNHIIVHIEGLEYSHLEEVEIRSFLNELKRKYEYHNVLTIDLYNTNDLITTSGIQIFFRIIQELDLVELNLLNCSENVLKIIRLCKLGNIFKSVTKETHPLIHQTAKEVRYILQI